MSIIAGTKPKVMTDRIIGLGLVSDAMVAANSLAAAVTAASNPDVKRLFKDYLQDTISALDEVQTYAVDQNWMSPFESPEQQLKMALQDADSLVGGQS